MHIGMYIVLTGNLSIFFNKICKIILQGSQSICYLALYIPNNHHLSKHLVAFFFWVPPLAQSWNRCTEVNYLLAAQWSVGKNRNTRGEKQSMHGGTGRQFPLGDWLGGWQNYVHIYTTCKRASCMPIIDSECKLPTALDTLFL